MYLSVLALFCGLHCMAVDGSNACTCGSVASGLPDSIWTLGRPYLAIQDVPCLCCAVLCVGARLRDSLLAGSAFAGGVCSSSPPRS